MTRRPALAAAEETAQERQEEPPSEDHGSFFARIPESVLISDLSHGAVRLYGVLDRGCGNDHTTFLSRTTLAARMACSPDSVDRYLGELVNAGAITVTKRWDEAGDPTTNLYYLAARVRLGSRVGAATPPRGRGHGRGMSAARGSRVGAAQNESQGEREPPNECVSPVVAEAVDAYAQAKGWKVVKAWREAMQQDGTTKRLQDLHEQLPDLPAAALVVALDKGVFYRQLLNGERDRFGNPIPPRLRHQPPAIDDDVDDVLDAQERAQAPSVADPALVPSRGEP